MAKYTPEFSEKCFTDLKRKKKKKKDNENLEYETYFSFPKFKKQI